MVTSEAWTELESGRGWLRGLPTEAVVSVVLSIILALGIALAGAMIRVPRTPDSSTIVAPVLEDGPEDLDPRDPLVRCEVFDTHTRCIREES